MSDGIVTDVNQPIVLPPELEGKSLDEPWRLNWPCGPVVREPYHHSDARFWPGMQASLDEPDVATWDHVGPIQRGLPWPDETFAGIHSAHGLQALTYGDLLPALVELRRLLTRGGTLRLLVPDLLAAVRAYDIGDAEHFQVADEHEASLDGKFALYVTQGGATRTVFTEAWLVELLGRAGFTEVAVCSAGVTEYGPAWITELDSRPAESLHVEARRT